MQTIKRDFDGRERRDNIGFDELIFMCQLKELINIHLLDCYWSLILGILY